MLKYYKNVLLISIAVICSSSLYAQNVFTRTDSITAAKLAAQANLSYQTGKKVYQAMNYGKDRIATLASDTSLKQQQVLANLRFIASERTRKLDSLLTVDDRRKLYRLRDSLKTLRRVADSLVLREHDEQMRQSATQRIKLSGN